MRNKIDLYRYCSRIISEYLKRFLKEREDALYSLDIEPVHRMRVASRRLMAALNVFKDILPAKKAKIWRKEIRKIGRALGCARQLDVQIKFLKAAKERLINNSSVLHTEAIIEYLKKKRKQAQKQIVIALEDFEIKKSLPGLKACLNEFSSGAKARVTGSFNAQKTAIILKRLDKLREFAPYVSRPRSTTELHRMRIAAKKLRYRLEILRPWYIAGLDKYIHASRDIQNLLGDLHELDVFTEVLSDFSGKGNEKFNYTFTYLTRECARLRKDAYIKFVRLWRHLEKSRLWVKLGNEV